MADIEAYVGQVMDDPKQVPNRKDQSKAKKSPTEPVKVQENRNPNVTITLDDTPEDNISLNDTIEDIPEITFNEDIIDNFNVVNDNAENDHANQIENSFDEAKWI